MFDDDNPPRVALKDRAAIAMFAVSSGKNYRDLLRGLSQARIGNPGLTVKQFLFG